MSKSKTNLPKVTIYSTGSIGAIVKTEGYLVSATEHTIVYFAPRARTRKSSIMSWHAPFRCIAKGWGLPDPSGAFEPAKPSTGGIMVERGRHSGASDGWTSEFIKDVVPRLDIVNMWTA